MRGKGVYSLEKRSGGASVPGDPEDPMFVLFVASIYVEMVSHLRRTPLQHSMGSRVDCGGYYCSGCYRGKEGRRHCILWGEIPRVSRHHCTWTVSMIGTVLICSSEATKENGWTSAAFVRDCSGSRCCVEEVNGV
jgi:hypothetical protein